MRCGSRASWSVRALPSRGGRWRVTNQVLCVTQLSHVRDMPEACICVTCGSTSSMYLCVGMLALTHKWHDRCACAGGVAVIFDKQQLILLEDCQEMMVRARLRAWFQFYLMTTAQCVSVVGLAHLCMYSMQNCNTWHLHVPNELKMFVTAK